MTKQKNSSNPSRTKKRVFTVAVIAILICLVSGATAAYIIAGTNSLTKSFDIADVSCEVSNTFGDDDLPENVVIKNTGSTTAYIRAAVVANWVLDDGSIYAEMPLEDYDYKLNCESKYWVVGADGFWYYTKPVNVNGSTAVMIDFCTRAKNVIPPNCKLSVQIVAEAIQSVPENAVLDSWSSGVEGVTGSILEIREAE